MGWLLGGLQRQATKSEIVCSKRVFLLFVLKNRMFPSQNSVKMPVWPQYVRQMGEDGDRRSKIRTHDGGSE